ncbi:Molybdenum ABC transporter, periplasmic molybdenum-binding protein ModA [Lachnospiraceae bacterium TWA4]|nr:Molybdenum ABC transporter, periplasmic molybdenum-binding protein ModA [Lachnospiraceae bacterium TWA4]
MKKRALVLLLVASLAGSVALTGCSNGGNSTGTTAANTTAAQTAAAGTTAASTDKIEATEIKIFAAKSLNKVMEELITEYNKTQPNVKVTGSYDSSGTLLTQIQEGAACDVFFSAAQKQMNTLQDENKLVVDGTRHNVVNNQVCVVTPKNSGTKVTGIANIKDAKNLALADGSVPVGKYTRQALVNGGQLEKVEDVSKITTQQVSDALGGIEINECPNVGAVTAAIAEGSNEVGTVYWSDIYGMDDKIDIVEKVPYDLTGDVIYPVAQVVNKEATEVESTAAVDFINFLTSDAAKAIFEKYQFDTNVTD